MMSFEREEWQHAEDLQKARAEVREKGIVTIGEAKATELGRAVNIVGIVERVRPEYTPRVKRNGRIWKDLVRINILIRDEENRTVLRVHSQWNLDYLYKQVKPGNMVYAFDVVRSTTPDSHAIPCFEGRRNNYWVVENPTYRQAPKIHFITWSITCKTASVKQRKLYRLIKRTPRASLLDLLDMPDNRIRRIIVRVTAIETSPLVEGTTVYVTDYYKPKEFQAAYNTKGEPLAQQGLPVNLMNLARDINVGEFYCFEGYVARDGELSIFKWMPNTTGQYDSRRPKN